MVRRWVAVLAGVPLALAAVPANAASLTGTDPADDLAWRGIPVPPSLLDDRFHMADLIQFDVVEAPNATLALTIRLQPRAEGPEAPVVGSTLFKVHFMAGSQPYQVVLERSRPLYSAVDDGSYISAYLCRETFDGGPAWPGKALDAWEDLPNATLHAMVPVKGMGRPLAGFWASSQSLTGIVAYGLWPMSGSAPDLPAVVDRLPDTGNVSGALGVPPGADNPATAVEPTASGTGSGPAATGPGGSAEPDQAGGARQSPGAPATLAVGLAAAMALLRRQRTGPS